MSDELRDAIAAAVEHDADIYQDTYGAADAVLAIPEIRKALALRTLIKGGPCETCGGKGLVDLGTDGTVLRSRHDGHVLVYNAPCPAGCTNGRTPGIIDLLRVTPNGDGTAPDPSPMGEPNGYAYRKWLTPIIAALREAVDLPNPPKPDMIRDGTKTYDRKDE